MVFFRVAVLFALLALTGCSAGTPGTAGPEGARGERGLVGSDGPQGAPGAAGVQGPAGTGFQVDKLALTPVVGLGDPSDGSGGQVVVEGRCPGPEFTLMTGGCWAGTPGDARVDSATAVLSSSGPVDGWDPAKHSGWHCVARGLAAGERLEATAVCFDPRGEQP